MTIAKKQITTAIILACVFLFALTGCTPEPTATDTAADETLTPEKNDRRFTDEQAALREQLIRGYQAATDESYAKSLPRIPEIMTVNMVLDHELVNPGEAVNLTIEANSQKTPNALLILTKDHLSQNPQVTEITLDWQKAGDNKYKAAWSYTPTATGNYLLNWKCDIGGDIPDFWRNFSCIDNDWTVLIINTNANGAKLPEPYLHKYHLPSNLFCGMPLWQIPPDAESFLRGSKDARQYGDDFMVSLWQSNTYCDQFKHEESKLYEEHPGVQQAVFNGYYNYLQKMGFPRHQQSIMVSSMSNEVAQAVRNAGFTIFGGLYADQNWADGGDYRINHWGMPARPFFMSGEDFRKCDISGQPAIIGVQQCHRQSCLCRDYNCVFSLESGADYMMDRYSQYHIPRTITDVTQSREYDFLRSIWDTKTIRKNPMFFTMCFEFAGFDWMPEMYQLQPLMVDYLAKEVGSNKLACVTPHGLADYYRSHFQDNPESVIYLPDMWAGRVITGYDRPKPPIYPDTVEIENGTFRAIMRKGETLPYVYYDYEKPWGYSFWGGVEAPRQVGGYVIPNTDARFTVKPPILDTRTLKATSAMTETASSTQITITVDSQIDRNNLALAVWDIPRAFSDDASKYTVNGASRFVPVAAPFTENLCGIVVADIKKGLNTITVNVLTQPREIEKMDLQLTDNIFTKVFTRDGGSMAYIYNAGDKPETITLNVPGDREVTLYNHATVSDAPIKLEGAATFTVVPKKPMRVIGLNFDELAAAVEGAQPIDITVKTPDCNINDCGL